MDDVQTVAVANGGHSLAEDALRHVFIDAVRVFHDVVVQVPSVPEFLYEVELVLGVYYFVEADDARVGDQLHAADLLVQVGLRDFVKFQLVDDLDGHSETREDVAGALHHGKVALPQRLFHVVQPRDLGHLYLSSRLFSAKEISCGVKPTAVQIDRVPCFAPGRPLQPTSVLCVLKQ